MKNEFEWGQSDSGIYVLLYYWRWKYFLGPLEVSKREQANVEFLTSSDEMHLQYELDSDRIKTCVLQLVNLDLEVDLHVEMLL